MNGDNPEEITHSPPKIYCTLPPMLLKQNHPASIPIKVTGRPTPKLEWFVKGMAVDRSPGYKVSTGPGRRSQPDEILTVLEISSVDQTLEGGIELVAVNDQGTDRFVVPLKTYRLLTGIYLEEEKEQKGVQAKGYEGVRTIDRRLFRNEVDEACKGIKIYQAYRNISKSYDDCNDAALSRAREDPAMRKWKREMAKRNLMKSIDDIIDNFDNEDPMAEYGRPDPAWDSSFRSENVPRTLQKAGKGQTTSGSLSAGKDCLRTRTLDPPRLAKKAGRAEPPLPPEKFAREDQKTNENGHEVFSFCGQKLSEFCEKVLQNKAKDGSRLTETKGSHGTEQAVVEVRDNHDDKSNYSLERNRFLIPENRDSDYSNITASNPISTMYTQINKHATKENARQMTDKICSRNDSDDGYDEVVLNHHQCQPLHKTSMGDNIYELIEVEDLDLTKESSKREPNLSQDVSAKTGQSLGLSESQTFSSKGEAVAVLERKGTDENGKSRREELINILSELNDQLEKWETEKERTSSDRPRPDAGKFQGRNSQCKSENLEEYSVDEISEYSKSLNELTEKLTKFEGGRNVQDPSKTFLHPLVESLETKTDRMESISSMELKNPLFKSKISTVRPNFTKKENRPKPAVPPKPKFLKDRETRFSTGTSQASSNSSESETIEASICNSRNLDEINNSVLCENALLQVSTSYSLLSSSVFSTPSSSSTSRSFTPSPSPVSGRVLASFPLSPQSSSESSAVHRESPLSSSSSSSTTADSPFTLSPLSPQQQATTFSSTKYKLVRPPAPLSLSDTPSSLSPMSSTSSSPLFLSPQQPPPPASCPASVEMSRKKIDKVWIPSIVNKSFKVYKISSRGRKTPLGGRQREEPTGGMTGSAGNVGTLENMEADPVCHQASSGSLEILPERRDSYASMEKYRALSNSRRALSKRYELVTITTKEETVLTLKNADGSKFRRKSLGKTAVPNPPESLNAAERLYYLLGGGKEKGEVGKEEGDNDDDDCHRDKTNQESLKGSDRLRIEAYKLPRDILKDQKVSKEKDESEISYEGLVTSLVSLAKDDDDDDDDIDNTGGEAK